VPSFARSGGSGLEDIGYGAAGADAGSKDTSIAFTDCSRRRRGRIRQRQDDSDTRDAKGHADRALGRTGQRTIADRLVTVTTALHPASTPALGDKIEMYSFALDAWFDDVTVLTDQHVLLTAMSAAAAAGRATVLGQAVAVFPNGAVTAALLLAESHLTVHTWPEHGLARFDLLTCGGLDGEIILRTCGRTCIPRAAMWCATSANRPSRPGMRAPRAGA
jgi:S-adenosylmethionine decarboxylase